MIPANGDCRSAADTARHYLRDGVQSVPLEPPTGEGKGKRPWDFPRNRLYDKWDQLAVTDTNIDELFPAGANIGLRLGAPSHGLVDTDLDCPEARRAAPHLLPRTDMVGGRASTPDSHRFFIVGSPPELASDKFRDPCIADRSCQPHPRTALDRWANGCGSQCLRHRSGQGAREPRKVRLEEPRRGGPRLDRGSSHRGARCCCHTPGAVLAQLESARCGPGGSPGACVGLVGSKNPP